MSGDKWTCSNFSAKFKVSESLNKRTFKLGSHYEFQFWNVGAECVEIETV